MNLRAVNYCFLEGEGVSITYEASSFGNHWKCFYCGHTVITPAQRQPKSGMSLQAKKMDSRRMEMFYVKL